MIQVTDAIAINENEIELRFVRAGGPGGQNVNKVASAVQMRFDVRSSPSLPDDVRERLMRIAGRRITQEGVLVLIGRRFRTQERNREDVMERFVELLRRAAVPVVPRRATRPSRSSRECRLKEKQYRGEKKRARRELPEE